MITNELGQEVLCYEMLGTIENDTFRMYINAKDGSEEKVEKLKMQNLYIKTYKNRRKGLNVFSFFHYVL